MVVIGRLESLPSQFTTRTLMNRNSLTRTFLTATLALAASAALAQPYTAGPHTVQQRKKQSAAFDRKYTAKLDSLISRYQGWKYEQADTLSNPYYASLFGSPVLYGGVLARGIGAAGEPGADGLCTDSCTAPALASSRHVYELVREADRLLLSTYALSPWLVRGEEAQTGELNIGTDVKETVRKDVHLTEKFDRKEKDDVITTVRPDDEWQVVAHRPNFWTFKTNFSLQFTQNYVSDNWYKGGESNNALLVSTTINANYNNQSKVTFDNCLEMKLGFQTSHNDEEHKFKTNSDLLRLTNKLGLRAVKNWYYTLMLQSWTQFYKGYRSNDKRVYSDFMSPFESLLSIGMDYQLNKKKFTLNATISPLALKLKYVGRPSLETSFGLKAGHHTKWDYGSNITVRYNWNICKSISWNGRIYYFTDYSKAQIEWENTFNLTINKYLSTRLFLYPRFDDARTRKEGESYFQFNELLSLGLNVNF